MARVFRPLDTSAVDQVLDRYERSTRDIAVRARILRRDVSCGDACETVRRVTQIIASRAGGTLRELFAEPTRQPLPADMLDLLRQLD